MKPIPCRWCGTADWDPHCPGSRCRWNRCHHCGALLDVQAMILLPPTASGQGPMPAE